MNENESGFIMMTAGMHNDCESDLNVTADIGVFFLGFIFMPMTGMFSKMSSDSYSIGGRPALAAWCVCFLSVGLLSFLHFRKR